MIKNNKGASLLAVIIAMAIIVLLGLGALYVSRNNYLMKVMDKESTDNFYSAESILNDVTTGIEKLMSDVYSESYSKTMANYNNFSTQADMTTSFNNDFVLGLVEALNDKEALGTLSRTVNSSVSYLYDKALIYSFVDASKFTDYTWTLEFTDHNTLTANDNVLDTIKDGIVLRNIFITFKNDKGYYNEIQTDIKITVPDLGFSVISALPNITDYAIIANKGFVLNQGKGAKVKGNLYAGQVNDSTKSAIQIKSGCKLDCTEAGLIVANSDIYLKETGIFYAGSQELKNNISLWAKGIKVDSKTLTTIYGRTYVQDDLTINGDNSTFNIGGQYLGYSNNVLKAAQSSAIIINGKNTTLNLSGLDSLVVAGTAFVSTSSVKNEVGKTNADVLIGDSIAVKSNQLAYLVPTECEDVKSNPMSNAQYEEMIKNTNWKNNILETNISSLNRTIKSYGDVSIVPVFSSKDGGTVYIYISFSNASSAAAYYMDLINSKSTLGTKLKDYIEKYIPTFQMKDKGVQVITEGNYLIPAHYDEKGNLVSTTYEQSNYSPSAMTSMLTNTSESFTALTKKLVTTKTSLTQEELKSTATVYSNLINEQAIKDFFNYTAVKGVEYSSSDTIKVAKFTLGDGYQGIIIDNPSATYSLNSGSGIVIATGTINVLGDWNGLIISGKAINISKRGISNPSKLFADKQISGKTLRLSCIVDDGGTQKTVSFLNFFKGGEGYNISENGETNFDYADLRNCIGFINWKK